MPASVHNLHRNVTPCWHMVAQRPCKKHEPLGCISGPDLRPQMWSQLLQTSTRLVPKCGLQNDPGSRTSKTAPEHFFWQPCLLVSLPAASTCTAGSALSCAYSLMVSAMQVSCQGAAQTRLEAMPRASFGGLGTIPGTVTPPSCPCGADYSCDGGISTNETL